MLKKSNLSQIIQLESGRSGLQTQAVDKGFPPMSWYLLLPNLAHTPIALGMLSIK